MKGVPSVFFLPLFVLFSCSGEEDKQLNNNTKRTIVLTGTQQRDTVFLAFSIPEKTVRATRTGKLERLVETPEFKKNNLLVQFDNYDAFVELSGEKEGLKDDITNMLNNLPKSMSPIEKKWRDFAGKLTPDKVMPAFPSVEFKEEAGLIEDAKIEAEYDRIHQKELALQNYFQLSKEDGFIIRALAHTDDYVKKNAVLIVYHPKKIRVTASASFPLSKRISGQIKSDLMLRIPVEQVKKIRSSPEKITYSLTLNQRLDPKICPKYVIVNLDQNAFHVPKEFIGKDGKVRIEGGNELVRAYKKRNGYWIYSKQTSLKVRTPDSAI